MYSISNILNKLNSHVNSSPNEPRVPLSMADIIMCPRSDLYKLTRGILTWGETRFLYEQAQQNIKANKILESRIFSHANPQVTRAVHLGIRTLPETNDYNDMFGGRADKFAQPGSVASMFSPAAYLTELYREGNKLHADGSPNDINTRRPDLASLALSQQNQDDEISTLALSNELLIPLCTGDQDTDVMETLASCRLSPENPYHCYYESVHHAISLQDETLSALEAAPAVVSQVSSAYLASIQSNISPELYTLLTEEIPEDDSALKEQWKKNFGKLPVELLSSTQLMAKYYNLSEETLTTLLSAPNVKKTGSQYTNNQYVSWRLSKNMPAEVITFMAGNINTDPFLKYAEILPGESKDHDYVLNVKYDFAQTKPSPLPTVGLWVYADAATALYKNMNLSVESKSYRFPLENMSEELLSRRFSVDVVRTLKHLNGVHYEARNRYNFSIKRIPVLQFLLYANKIIRLYKASGLSAEIIRKIVSSQNLLFDIDKQTLSILFYVRQAMQAYGIDAEQALVFTHAGISQLSINNSVPLFDRLFNTPLLNNQKFSANGQTLDLSFDSDITDSFTLNVLKRGLQVNDNELRLLWAMASNTPASKFTCTLSNISSLYLVRLIAEVHGLSVNELAILKSISSLRDVPLESLTTADELGATISYIRSACRWLKEQSWSISQLFIMTTQTYSTNLTPDIDNLLATLRSGIDSTLSAGEQLTHAIPLIAATAQLGNNEAAASLLRWLDMLAPAELTTAEFLSMVLKTSQTPEELSKIVIFCQVLAQLSLSFRSLRLSDGELHHLTLNPHLLNNTLSSLPHDVATLQLLTRFHAFINRCGSLANDVLTGLSNGRIETDKLAEILNYDKMAVAQAQQLVSPNKAVISDFATIDKMMQWLSVAATLCITPADVNSLLKLDYGIQTKDTGATLPEWKKISQVMAAGLKPQQTQQLQDTLDESLSTALSAYYLNVVNKIGLHTREQLYNYLLIDGQVSAQVKTTHLAEAIASLQLYITQTLNMPDDIQLDAPTSQFFRDWDTYNKRYSTWAGVSQLAYYPENYIDPSIRIGQTKMMDDLLQSISQSSINKDTVESAFKTYLTSFEQVANLDVISAYHDNTSIDTGLTYFIGCNQAQQTTYYWRSADHSKMQDGVMAANAWTEWNKIELGVSPYLKLLQPVIFNSRLYLCWIERTDEAKQDGTTTTATASYTLKLSHICYDNSWSTPVGFDITDDVKSVSKPALYASNNDAKQELIIGIHNKEDSYPDEAPEKLKYHCISNDMTQRNPVGIEIKEIYLYSQHQFDTTNSKTVKNAYAVKYSAPTKITSSTSIVSNKDVDLSASSLPKIFLSNVEDKTVELNFITNFSLDIAMHSSVPSELMAYIKPIYSYGDALYIFHTKDDYAGRILYCVVNKERNVLGILLNDGEKFSKTLATVVLTITDTVHNVDIINVVELSGETTNNYDYMQTFELTPEQVANLTGSKLKMTAAIADNGINTNFIAGYNERVIEFIKYDLEPNYLIKDLVIDINGKQNSYTSWKSSSSDLDLGAHNLFTSIPLKEKLTSSDFSNGIHDTNVILKALDKDKNILSSRQFVIETRIVSSNSTDVITLNTNAKKAQYMTVRSDKVRLNTLFAKKLVERANSGIDTILTLETQQLPEPSLDANDGNVPMDFAGANALYFWELFYYTPMLIAQRFLQEQRFTEATNWLKYIFSPSGYIVHGEHTSRSWNVRPLLDDTSWNDNPLDSVDPDAVAQSDPMHYKVATFMHALDQLIARGDGAYRLLERDTLNEAKMWYTQALSMLGDELEYDTATNWSAPRLDDAASETTQHDRHAALIDLREDKTLRDVRTANSLLKLFFPQFNDKLEGYWNTLRQRLYNLRHNLSIDGQPLSLSLFASPADPAAMLSAAATASQGGAVLPEAIMPMYRFPVMLESARSMVSQLSQFGSLLLRVAEQQDGEAMAELLQNQGREVSLLVIAQQNQTIAEIEADQRALKETRNGAQSRLDSYRQLYDGDVSAGEKQAMELYSAAAIESATATTSYMISAGLDLTPNIYGMAVGGSRYGAIAKAVGLGIEVAAGVTRASADKISQSEAYRRRRKEWEIQRNAAESDVKQIDAQLASLDIRREAAALQKSLLETQQGHVEAQLAFLQTKFTQQALYNWLRGKLAAIYYQFYDLTVSRCLMAQEAYKWALSEKAASFIKPGAWQGSYAGLLAGESLMLNLAQMEQAYLKKDERALEVTRTVSLADVYQKLSSDAFDLHTEALEQIGSGKGSAGSAGNTLSITSGQLEAAVKLSDLNIHADYPSDLGDVRNIRQISVTLPALVGPYEDVRAVLSYSGGTLMPRGCKSIAISHGMNDSGQFVLDFNDPRYLPFEGIPVTDSGSLMLTFPEATAAQKTLLESLSDIILHIRYTIRS